MIANQRYNKFVPIVKSDAVDFVAQGIGGRKLCDAIYVGGAGVVAVINEDNVETDFTVVAGAILPVAARRVNSTNTTATLMVALYAI